MTSQSCISRRVPLEPVAKLDWHAWCWQVVEGCVQACQQFRALSKGPQGRLEQEVALLHIQASLISIAESMPDSAAAQQPLVTARGAPALVGLLRVPHGRQAEANAKLGHIRRHPFGDIAQSKLLRCARLRSFCAAPLG